MHRITSCTSDFKCKRHSSYAADMSFDIPTCQNPDAIYNISMGIGEGCVCDPGYIRDANECVPLDQCGCVYEEQNYMYLKVFCSKYTSMHHHVNLLPMWENICQIVVL